MPTPLENYIERRARPRTIINSQVKYKSCGDTLYRTAKMVDLSQTGVLIELSQKLAINARLSLLVETDEKDEPPLEILVEVIRIAETSVDKQYSYGCLIKDHRLLY